jgi:formate dehydrogenase subunit beta
MSKTLKTNIGASEGIRNFLKYLLDSGKVKGIFTLKKMNESGAVAYSLVTGLEELEKADPLYPLMPVNAGKVLSEMTLKEAASEPVAAFLRPCELRAFTELVKRAQGSPENLLLISLTCSGVFPLSSITDGRLEKQLASYRESSRQGENAVGLRRTCEACTSFVPCQADITLAFAGKSDLDKACTLFLETSKGEEYARGAPGNMGSDEIETKELSQLREKRAAQRNRLFKEMETNTQGQKALVKTFAACLSCHGCSHVCPICHCLLCTFDSKMHDSQPWSLESELEHKGGTRVPSGTLFFHLGRMAHMAVSCVSCGMCSDVCPVNIPVAEIFSMAGDSLQKVFEYFPGRDIKETVPSGTYKEEEFVEIGEQ